MLGLNIDETVDQPEISLNQTSEKLIINKFKPN